ncbi:MAG: hypothetical protein ACHQIM_18710, partial [Sphingobacteriales bacterium]
KINLKMNIKLLTVAMGIALTATSISANAQKAYTSGVVSYATEMMGQATDVKIYFTPDSTSEIRTFGPGSVKILSNAKHDFLAVVLDIPIANRQKVGIATPAELEGGADAYPSFTYTPTSETKQISGFNCKKVIAKNSKDGKTYDVWITNDITVPTTAYHFFYAAVGGFPVQYTDFVNGPTGLIETSITITSISDQGAPAGTYAYPKDFEKGTLGELFGG